MRQGFTLIEILVVVLIIGILASVAVPQYQIAVNKSRTTEGINLLARVVSAQEAWYERKNEYAEDISALPIDISAYPGNNNYNVVTCKAYDVDYIRTCFAYSTIYSNDNLPELEFYLRYGKYGKPEIWSGKRWCLAHQDNSIASAVCKSLGRYERSGIDSLGKPIWYYEIDR